MAARSSWGGRHIAVLLLLVLPLLLSGAATDHARAGTATRYRDRMLKLVNTVRADRNRDALELDARLSRYALRHSREMAAAGSLFHTEDLAARLRGRQWSTVGENVGVGSSLRDVLATFMGSWPHRRNILRAAFDHAGVGVARSNGKVWVTIIFYG